MPLYRNKESYTTIPLKAFTLAVFSALGVLAALSVLVFLDLRQWPKTDRMIPLAWVLLGGVATLVCVLLFFWYVDLAKAEITQREMDLDDAD